MKPPPRYCVLAVASVVSVFSASRLVAAAEKNKPGITIDWGNTKLDGDKVEARYSAQGLKQAFAALCKNLRYRAIRVEVDQSESPNLLYGMLEGRCDYRAIRDALNSMPGYAYSGCVTLVKGDGAATVFSLNMIPASEY